MPLVKIDMIKGRRAPEQIKKLGDTIQEVLFETFDAPVRDRYQIVTQHEPYELMCLDTGLGFGRTQDLICIQIFQQGRDRAKKEALFAALAKGLEASCGVKGNDLIVSVFANSPEDWSFRYGEAQFLNGKL